MNGVKVIRAQVEDCVKVEFINGGMACSCTMVRGTLPNLRVLDAVLGLNALAPGGVGDPDHDHGVADEIILSLVDPEVAAAYERLVERSAWWANA